MIKMILNQYNFHQFKTRLEYGCEKQGCLLIKVHSALTSKLCCNCGNKTEVGASEEYNCPSCNQTYDRDENAGVNMIIKGLTAIQQ
jgi:transposase